MPDELKKQVSHVRDLLLKFQDAKKQELWTVARSIEEITVVEEHVTRYSIPTDSTEYQRLSTYALAYGGAVQSEILRTQASTQTLTSGSLMLSGTASAYARFFPEEMPILRCEIEAIAQRYELRESVYSMLKAHSTVIADEFRSAWQALEMSMADPLRGPAFLMRETLTHLLHHFAPDEMVESQPWWKRHDERTKFTREDRLRFMLEHCILPEHRGSDLVKLQLEEFKSLHGDLNRTHDNKELDADRMKDILYRSQAVLLALLPVLLPCPHSVQLRSA